MASIIVSLCPIITGVREVPPEEGKFKLRLEGHVEGMLAAVGEGVREEDAPGRGKHTCEGPGTRGSMASLRNYIMAR